MLPYHCIIVLLSVCALAGPLVAGCSEGIIAVALFSPSIFWATIRAWVQISVVLTPLI